MPDNTSPRSSAEKRILWELGRRYKLSNSGARAALPLRTAPPREQVRPQQRVRPVRARGAWRRLFMLLLAVLFLGGGIFGYRILAASNRISVADRSLLGQLKDLLLSSGNMLEGESDGRINILLIAIGGEGHKGENLADTIIVASVRPSTSGP
ncbi:MAG: hypothetical protein AAB538_03590, partial [Patescibacteria group bacterium]